ncbi:MAG: discoidin domain-containing protein [Chloroflexi bacterium]|nr:discoidin domain-containing protein [Chloroflexota bacterium]
MLTTIILMVAACGGVLPSPTPTPVPPTDTPLPPTALPTATPEPQPAYTSDFAVSFIGELFGDAENVHDGRTETWASLRAGGHGTWVFDLGEKMLVSAVKFWPVVDTGDAVFVTSVDVGVDGQTWTTAFGGANDCGRPDCSNYLPDEWSELKFASPLLARYVRLNAGPRWLALAEVEIEVLPFAP